MYKRLRTFIGSSWFKSIIITTMNLTEKKHRHPAGAFFLALIRGNSFESLEYRYVLSLGNVGNKVLL